MATRAAALVPPPVAAAGTDSASAAVEGDVEELDGVVERVVYHSRESGFCVLRVRVPEQRKLATVVGHAPSVVAGESIAATGSWVWHRSHGLQFRATALSSALSAGGADGVESCLGAGLLKGIGPTYAKRLLGAFGDRLFEVIEREPERLREVPGIGLARAERIAACWTEQRALRGIMLFLHDHGLGGSRALRIYEAYGPGAVELVRADPYRLARDIPGIAFTAADSVAARLGLAPDDPVRVRAGLAQAVAAARGEGHAGLPLPEVVQRAADLLGLPDAAVARAVAAGEAEAAGLVRDLLGGRPHAFAADLHGDELTIARRLRALASGTLPWPAVDPAAAVERVERAAGLVLSECQRRALNKVLLSKVAVITGGPGVGKTLLVKAVLEILRGSGVRALLAAPTGRAAKRLSDLTGREARTLHRLLEVVDARDRETFRRTEANPLEADLVVVDETSMVDVPLLAALLRAVPDRAALLLVGDVDQLPPIGPGQALADLIASGAVPTARIDEVLRQPPGSRIVANAHRVRRGLMPGLAPSDDGERPSDFYFVGARSPADAIAKIVEMAGVRIPRRFGLDPVRDVQVLCPTNEGGLGTRALNAELQRVLNPQAGPRIERAGWSYHLGDKVMQLENDYEREVYNGDLGTVAHVDPLESTLLVSFGTRLVAYRGAELDRLTLAYATTVHKAQGSEYPAVIVPVMAQHGRALSCNLIYTAITRGRRLVVLVGDRNALARGLKVEAERRVSKLRERLESPLAPPAESEAAA